ncbi:DUF4376 domain-containing protein [Escherichia coli]|uniref:DUF4376 domain-containing protein n=1 Tax=Escherichia coli TaxID=562 RepID=A0A6D0I6M0_ECOLX|nr:DUF4376 domain-containing protein [Escherichia coli]KAE9864867.1 DUF4376 domain-containing protein [Escherichia coli]MWR12410.1 DUF4376 domain-containing protein [Escherichia coli]MWS15188.1 DUF4376 domain-containing protein [Escherichia coli]
MKIIDIKAMKYLEDGSVSCEVLFEGRADYIPYRAVENDSAASGQRVWGTLMSGEFGEIIPFTVTAEMLDKEKELKKEEIRRWRTEQEAQPFTFEWNGRTWNGGADSISRIAPVAMAAKVAGVRSTLGWGDAANNLVTLTMAQLQELAAAMAQAQVKRNDEIYQRQREMKEELNNLEDLRSIRAMTISSN